MVEPQGGKEGRIDVLERKDTRIDVLERKDTILQYITSTS